MPTTDQLIPALQVYQEIKAELHKAQGPKVFLPTDPILENSGYPVATSTPVEGCLPNTHVPLASALPDGSMMLGVAEDGIPVVMNLYDPESGPILVAGDGGSGKTALLQFMAQAAGFNDPGDIQFGVLTPFTEEWTALEALPNCLGIWPAHHSSAAKFLSQLVSWAEVLPRTRQAVLLLFDGLDLLLAGGFQVHRDLRWLLLNGPQRHILPVVTINPGRLGRYGTWLDYFQTRILGKVKRTQNARLMGIDPEIDLSEMVPGEQFGFSRADEWLKFHLPVIH